MEQPEPEAAEQFFPRHVRKAIQSGLWQEAADALEKAPSQRRAEFFIGLRHREQKALLAHASTGLAATLLSECDGAVVSRILPTLDLPAFAGAFRLLPPDDMADLLLRLPRELATRVLGLLEPAHRRETENLLIFDPGTAGGLMTPRYLSVPDVVTVGGAYRILRAAKESESPSYIYVVNAYGKLVGVVPLRRLVLSNPRQPIRSIMLGEIRHLRTSAGKEEIIEAFHRYRFASLPVVDDKDRLVGIVTFDDAMSALQRGDEEVIHAVTGADPRERLQETFTATRGRIPWITVTLLGGLGCALIAGFFQKALSEMIVLGIFVPIVLALGESIGAQTTSMVLLMLEETHPSRAEFLRFLGKEFLIALFVGIYAGAVISLVSLLWHGNGRLGLLIGSSVLVSISWAALLGVLVPWSMRRLRVNPAVASGPMVLALADLSTLLVYLGGATLFLEALR